MTRQKDQDVYFVGKVLNASEMPDDNAKTFAFTKEERASLNLKDVPIQLEHEESMKVGKIKNSWFDHNHQMWVMGEINGKDIPSTFAKYALQASGKDKQHNPYYTGLSLSHVHREYASGKTEKIPIEVSLCTDPRRPNCKIIYASNNKTKNNTYKCVKQIASNTNNVKKKNNMAAVATEQIQQVPQQQNTTEQPPATQMQQSPPATDAQQPNQEMLSQQVYDEMSTLYKRDKDQQEQIAKMQAELSKHQQTLQEAETKKKDEMAQKGRAIMATFLEHMKDLVGDDANGLQQDVEPLIAANPDHMNRVLEVVAKASKRYKDQNNELRTTKSDLRDKELELKFQTLIKQNTDNLAQVNTQVVENASRKRSAPVANNMMANNTTTATKQIVKSFNPYKTVDRLNRQQAKGRPSRPGMNKELFSAFKSMRSGGNGYNSMNTIHKDLSERRRNTYF